MSTGHKLSRFHLAYIDAGLFYYSVSTILGYSMKVCTNGVLN